MSQAQSVQITARADGARITVQVKPRSSKSGLAGVKEGALVIALRSPPVESAANRELIEVMADLLGVRKSDVTIATGTGSKKKMVDVRGVTLDHVRACLGAVG
jgi:uncharacterized protein (TIGR00251 family)